MSGVSQVLERRARWRRCRELLRDVPIPDPFNVDLFCQQIGQRRGRPIHVRPQSGTSVDGPCGVWIAMATEDVIFVDPSVAPLHYEHIVLHEVGHMLWDHAPDTTVIDGLTTRLLPDLDPTLVQRVLARTNYSSAREEEAEMLATMVGVRRAAQAAAAPTCPAAPGQVTAALGRLSDALGSPGQPRG